jgi:hypothetical protein
MGVRATGIARQVLEEMKRTVAALENGQAVGGGSQIRLRESAAGGLGVRESEEQRAVRLKEERREAKDQRRMVRETFQSSGMDKKSAKRAARLLESDAYQARYRGL